MADGLLFPAAAVVAAIGILVLMFFAWKGRPFAEGDLFRASRWSRGNRWFPTQVLITPTSVVHYTPELVGRKEHSIHIAHVASVSIDTNLLFSDVIIETSGGTAAVRCHGHHKADAVRMKQLIEQYQTQYYRAPAKRSAEAVGDAGRSRAGASGEGGLVEVVRG